MAPFPPLQVSQRCRVPPLRRRVETLEARAGVELLARGTHGVQPTTAGRVLLAKGQDMIRQTTTLLDRADEVEAGMTGRVHIAMPLGLPPTLMAFWVRHMHKTFPALQFAMSFEGDSLAGLENGADIAVHRTAKPIGPWITEQLAPSHIRLAASPRYLAEHGEPKRIEELRGHTLLALGAPEERQDDASPGRQIWPLLNGAFFSLDPAMIIPDLPLLTRCARKGMGIALLPAIVPEAPSEVGRLQPVLKDVVGATKVLHITIPRALGEIPKVNGVVKQTIHLFKRFMTEPTPR